MKLVYLINRSDQFALNKVKNKIIISTEPNSYLDCDIL